MGIKLLDDNLWVTSMDDYLKSGHQRTYYPLKLPKVELMTNYLQEIKRLEELIEEKKKKTTFLQFMQDNGE